MSSSAINSQAPSATKVVVGDDALTVDLADGRSITVPIAWYPRLTHATSQERDDCRLIAGGKGIHWESLDEDISIDNLLAGRPSGESQASFKKWLAGRKQ